METAGPKFIFESLELFRPKSKIAVILLAVLLYFILYVPKFDDICKIPHIDETTRSILITFLYLLSLFALIDIFLIIARNIWIGIKILLTIVLLKVKIESLLIADARFLCWLLILEIRKPNREDVDLAALVDRGLIFYILHDNHRYYEIPLFLFEYYLRKRDTILKIVFSKYPSVPQLLLQNQTQQRVTHTIASYLRDHQTDLKLSTQYSQYQNNALDNVGQPDNPEDDDDDIA